MRSWRTRSHADSRRGSRWVRPKTATPSVSHRAGRRGRSCGHHEDGAVAHRASRNYRPESPGRREGAHSQCSESSDRSLREVRDRPCLRSRLSERQRCVGVAGPLLQTGGIHGHIRVAQTGHHEGVDRRRDAAASIGHHAGLRLVGEHRSNLLQGQESTGLGIDHAARRNVDGTWDVSAISIDLDLATENRRWQGIDQA